MICCRECEEHFRVSWLGCFESAARNVNVIYSWARRAHAWVGRVPLHALQAKLLPMRAPRASKGERQRQATSSARALGGAPGAGGARELSGAAAPLALARLRLHLPPVAEEQRGSAFCVERRAPREAAARRRPRGAAEGESASWLSRGERRQKLRSPARARAMACSLVISAHCLIYLKKAGCKEDSPLTSPLCAARPLLAVEQSERELSNSADQQQRFTRALLELQQQRRRQQRRRGWLHDCARGAGKGSSSLCPSSPASASSDPAAPGRRLRHSAKNCQSLVEPKS